MRTKLTKIALTATFVVALALTISCGEHGNGDDPVSSSGTAGNPSSSSSGGLSSSSSGTSSSSGNAFVGESGTFTDARDSKAYNWVKIGTQIWMAENLNYEEEQIGSTRGSRCYDDKNENCQKYGRLYEWDDALLVCPDGWHLPTQTEWNALISHIGTDAGMKLKSTSSDWRDGTGGTDEYGFTAFPGGVLTSEFEQFNIGGYWWTATEDGGEYAFAEIMEAGKNVIQRGRVTYSGDPRIVGRYKTYHFSVRCVKGSSPSSPVAYGKVTDNRDNKEYKTVKIGQQTWMVQNLNFAGKGVCYNGVASNCETYGRLYNWATAMDAPEGYNTGLLNATPGYRQGICMEGWHLPTSSEWNALISYAKLDASLNYKDGYTAKKLKAKSGEWGDYYGIDSYGFGALPSGALTSEFVQLNMIGYWWTATEDGGEYAFAEIMASGDDAIQRGRVTYSGDPSIVGRYKTSHFSVRCVED